MRKIQVLYYPVGHPPEVREVADMLPDWQGLVGGYIEEHGIAPGLVVVCNEEGRIMDPPLPFNRWFAGLDFLGAFFVTKHDTEGESCSLSEKELRQAQMLEHADPGVEGAEGPGLTIARALFARDLRRYFDAGLTLADFRAELTAFVGGYPAQGPRHPRGQFIQFLLLAKLEISEMLLPAKAAQAHISPADTLLEAWEKPASLEMIGRVQRFLTEDLT